jgi:cardiolipin synthase C
VPVEDLYNGAGLFKKYVQIDAAGVQEVYDELRRYAGDPANFAPEIRAAIAAIPTAFAQLSRDVFWTRAEYVSDLSGKNESHFSLKGGGDSTSALASMLRDAKREVVIESPYLVLSDAAFELFKTLRARGMRIRICTNSLASTDNLQAFSGYRNQRKKLLAAGLEIART